VLKGGQAFKDFKKTT